jgi:hypothetical protein
VPLSEPYSELKSIWGNSSSDLYVAGGGRLLRFDGSRWSEGGGGTSPDDVFFLGARHVIHGHP